MKRILNTRKNRNDTNCSVELVQKRVIPVAAMSEYAEAVANGFVGTFEDYQKYKASLTSALLQPQLDVINIRLDNLEGSVTRLGQELDLLDDRVTDIEANIIIQEGLIQSKVSQTEFDNLKGTVTSQGTQISQNSQAITLKAEKSTVDALGNRVSDNEATLSVHAGLIQSKVSQTDFDALSGTVSQQSTQISQNAQQINLRATQTSVDALGNRVTTAESNITQNATEISMRVTQGEIESNFSMTPNKMKLFSKEIAMTGMIQFTSMDTSTQNYITTIDGGRIVTNTLEGDKIKVGTLTGDRLTANSITGDKIQANSITADKLDVNTITAKTIQTASEGERTTIGYRPNSPDPTSDWTGHGIRQYYPNGQIMSYIGYVPYINTGTTVIDKSFAIVVWKPDGSIFFSLDSSTQNIQYITVPTPSWFETTGIYLQSTLTPAQFHTKLMSDLTDRYYKYETSSTVLFSKRSIGYKRIMSGEPTKLVNANNSDTPVADGWYLIRFGVTEMPSSSISIATAVAERYEGGIYQEQMTLDYSVEAIDANIYTRFTNLSTNVISSRTISNTAVPSGDSGSPDLLTRYFN